MSNSVPVEAPIATFGEKVRVEVYQSPSIGDVKLPLSFRCLRDYTDSTGQKQTVGYFNPEHLQDLMSAISYAQSWVRLRETAPAS